MFGEVDFKPANAYSSVPIEEQMEALTKAVNAGKVRQIGLSNETAWGLTRFCQLGMNIFSVLDAYHGAWQCPCIMMCAIHLCQSYLPEQGWAVFKLPSLIASHLCVSC